MADFSNRPEIAIFGRQLKRLRERAGLSQKALSEVTGLTVKQISKLENGRAEPKYLTLLAFSAAIGVPIDAFRGEDGDTHDSRE